MELSRTEVDLFSVEEAVGVCARAQSEGELTRETLRILELESTPIEVLAVALRSRNRPRPRLPG